MVVAAMKYMASNFAKLDKFKGVDLRRWQKKMHFLVSNMSVVYVLTTPIPEDGENATMEQIIKRNKWDNDDYVCRGLVLNDFKHTLKYQKEELTLVELGSHLRIEESLMVQDNDKPKGNNVVGFPVVNMVEHNNSLWMMMLHGGLTQEQLCMCVKINVGSRPTKFTKDGSILHVGNESTTMVHGHSYVDLRLGHVHFKRMQDMSKDGLIPAFDMDTEKCKTCMLTKINKKPFQNVKRETKVLQLIHSDLCDLHATPSLGNKKYFVTFIDDASRFYVIEPNESVAINSIIESKNAILDENIFSSVPRPSLRIPNGTEDIGGTRDDVSDQHSYCFNVKDDPKTFDEAMKSQDVAFWKEAINDDHGQ
ncbi:zinc finger, CCHC-type containing protein [Tanacetum coccineum]